MEISAQMVKELRESTGAGMMDCKKALVETNGDMEKAVDLLREKGLGKAAKKADRLASEGLVCVEVNGNAATISEVNSETDFVARNQNFIDLVKNITIHVQKNSIETVEALNESVIDGVKFEDHLKTQIATIGENLVVRRFETIKAGANGVVQGYLHSNSRVGVIIAAACDSEKTAEGAKDLIRNLCMHAAAMKPSVISYKDLDKEFIEKEFAALVGELEKDNEERVRLGKPLHKIPVYGSRAQITDEVLAAETENLKAELKKQNKPEQIWDKIIPGQIDKFIADNTQIDQRLTLMGQFFVMDDKKTIEQVVAETAEKLGGKIEIVKYVRFEVGEGLEKKVDDFAAEVAAQIG
ncbi:MULTISPECIES: translation elongation factor Ts [unclassified Campylobacter]|uniref:translation elongation factor Ts n=1 Tax=unclassified Campylobacter TaxID=2593542 RepID=UPI0022E9D33F|nr:MULTISPECIES: translation elongation factor Ts [unclassified Campylobacter]MDA3042506.1 translation elongation factor Ts [Campylobacter sp. JMF_09 ED2]MDA3044680.1 translation elongation factor Ts [Campylobacter sp. JMF_07 ED4]MDA3063198.1 translation elongation factor Ts [Campylobacter sp. JMF_11 EL3]MDA3071657.1 translation elongation factor Ts [Campylobacter sp. VBCF_03 NA9]MDA3074279.1 translation elongation factor Ts [Campylobacter sp. JMF_05 ED3]